MHFVVQINSSTCYVLIKCLPIFRRETRREAGRARTEASRKGADPRRGDKTNGQSQQEGGTRSAGHPPTRETSQRVPEEAAGYNPQDDGYCVGAQHEPGRS